jgi:hypothetical protein
VAGVQLEEAVETGKGPGRGKKEGIREMINLSKITPLISVQKRTKRGCSSQRDRIIECCFIPWLKLSNVVVADVEEVQRSDGGERVFLHLRDPVVAHVQVAKLADVRKNLAAQTAQLVEAQVQGLESDERQIDRLTT